MNNRSSGGTNNVSKYFLFLLIAGNLITGNNAFPQSKGELGTQAGYASISKIYVGDQTYNGHKVFVKNNINGPIYFPSYDLLPAGQAWNVGIEILASGGDGLYYLHIKSQPPSPWNPFFEAILSDESTPIDMTNLSYHTFNMGVVNPSYSSAPAEYLVLEVKEKVFLIDPVHQTKNIQLITDADAPITSVNSLPPTQTATTFTVDWSGGSDVGSSNLINGPSGIWMYDVFYKINNGSWQYWQIGTTLTSSSFTGSPGNTYYFKSVGYDNVGNREADPSGNGDTYTTILNPSITITSPNGGENWLVGSNHNITWTSTGLSGNVRIEYSINNGSSFNTLIASTPNVGSYPWTIPNLPSASCLVRVCDTDGNPVDQSNSVFTITSIPAITVTAPNGGENWTVGSTHNITWTSTGLSGYVRIEYSINNGSSFNTLIVSTPDIGSYPWTIPNLPSINCLVRVCDIDGNPADQSNSVFTIALAPTITVTSPNGGENWLVGSSHSITWTSTATSGTVRIIYSTNNGSNWTLETLSTPDDGSYIWTVPNVPSTSCLIKIDDTNESIGDQSNSVFTITPMEAITVIAPNGGENWQVGSIQDITWTTTGTSGTVGILYSTNNGSNWITLISSTADNGSYQWTVPDSPSSNCLVRINDTDGSPIDQSNSVFTIESVPEINVTSPNGGENWQVGSSHNITWTSTGTSGTVRIIYSTNNGSSWTMISNTPDDGSYTWTIPNEPSTSCLIKIDDTNESVGDQSNSIFTIALVPTITVTSPNGGENWLVGSNHNITWTSIDLSGYVRIEYSIDNGSSFNTLIVSTPDDGSYTWTIPNLPSSSCLIRVCDIDGIPADVSNGAFIIVCNPPSQPGFITGSTTVCQESSQTYSISTVAGATSYTWTLPSGWSGISISASITVTVGSIGGTISVSADNSCGSSLPTSMNIILASKPSVTTTIVNEATSSTATGGGNVTSNGGENITERGVCWSTAINPTIYDSKSSDGTSNGPFTSIITDLTNGVTYHIRAFATNCSGTGYGSDITYSHITTGIVDIQTDEISIYPNPVSGILNIEYKNNNYKTINIISSQGLLLEKEKAITPRQQLDFSKYEYGIYILEFVTSGGVAKRIKVVNH
jgi:hypothetical protein